MFNCGLPKLVVGVWLFFTSLQLTAAPSIYEYYILNPRIENGALSVISLALVLPIATLFRLALPHSPSTVIKPVASLLVLI